MFIVRHRGDGSYLEGVRGICAVWCLALSRAYRFQSADDAFTTAYLTCITTAPEDLQVLPVVDRPRVLAVGGAA